MTEKDRIRELERDVQSLQRAVGNLIAWMAQSANTPISPKEAGVLLQQLAGIGKPDAS